MYRPAYSRLDDQALVDTLIDAHPFATLVRVVGGAPMIAYAPMYRDGGDLIGHLARANPFTTGLAGAQVTALFAGPHGYVSPTWYAAPETQVPTWNYVTVEARGVAAEVPAAPVLARMVAVHEAEWRTEPGLEARLATAIVAFRMVGPTIEAKAKLSQNRDAADADRVTAQFDTLDPALAAWMRRVRA